MKKNSEKKNSERSYLDGYMTVEAGFIVPLVFIIFLLTIYFVFYLFNYCVINQNTYLAALRGNQQKAATKNEVKAFVENQLNDLLDEQIYQYQLKYGVTVSLTTIQVNSESKIENRLAQFNLYNKEKMESASKKKFKRIHLVSDTWRVYPLEK